MPGQAQEKIATQRDHRLGRSGLIYRSGTAEQRITERTQRTTLGRSTSGKQVVLALRFEAETLG